MKNFGREHKKSGLPNERFIKKEKANDEND